MKTTLTRIHLGLGMNEIGVQFEAEDDVNAPGVQTTQRAFVTLADDSVLAPVWAAAQVALDAELGILPLDVKPAAVTTALMQRRNALQEAEKADARRAKALDDAQRAEAAKAAAEQRLAELNAEIATKDAAKAALEDTKP